MNALKAVVGRCDAHVGSPLGGSEGGDGNVGNLDPLFMLSQSIALAALK